MTAKNNDRNMLLKLLPVISIFTFFVIWELIVVFQVVPNQLLASPTQVVSMFFVKLTNANPDGALLWEHTKISLTEALIGYLAALVIGIPVGLAMGWFKTLDGLVRPIFEIVRPIPSVAWIPLCIIWFGTGLASKVFIIFMGGLVPCVINSYTGVSMTNPTFIRMARTYGASNWDIFKNICVPSALPMVFGGLQTALAVAWTCLVAAELVGANAGLGFLITMGRRLLMPDMIILGMVMVALTGVIMTIIIGKVEKALVKGMKRGGA
ncbi:MAG: ABC transporter permease [Dehalobacterium sp.]